jgi:hypothetical protein
MKQWFFCTVMLAMMLLAACTPRIYGVPQERWETMSEQERIAAIEAYQARQEVLRQQRQEQARLQAIEKQAQLAREAEKAHRRQLQIDAIYRGEGLYGDLLRVNLEGGKLRIHGHHQPFHPVSFKIAAAEMKDIEIVSLNGQRTRMAVQYDGSNLLLDESPQPHRSTAIRLPYEDSWEVGATYTNRFAKGPLEMKGVNIAVQIVGNPPHDIHGRRHQPQVIVVRPPSQKPQKPEVIVIREPGHRPQPKEEMSLPPKRIRVIFRKGRLMMKKHRDQLVPLTIDLRDGQIRNVIMRSRNGNLKIQVSYLGGELLIDDTPGNGRKGTRLGFVPGWKNGQNYVIESSGSRLLEDLDVFIVSQ